MAISFAPDVLRARFKELGARKAEIEAETAPLRAKRDKIMNDATAKAKAIEGQYRGIERDGGLFEIDQERAAISRALGGKTADPE